MFTPIDVVKPQFAAHLRHAKPYGFALKGAVQIRDIEITEKKDPKTDVFESSSMRKTGNKVRKQG